MFAELTLWSSAIIITNSSARFFAIARYCQCFSGIWDVGRRITHTKCALFIPSRPAESTRSRLIGSSHHTYVFHDLPQLEFSSSALQSNVTLQYPFCILRTERYFAFLIAQLLRASCPFAKCRATKQIRVTCRVKTTLARQMWQATQ
jgi:hypothetical protein